MSLTVLPSKVRVEAILTLPLYAVPIFKTIKTWAEIPLRQRGRLTYGDYIASSVLLDELTVGLFWTEPINLQLGVNAGFPIALSWVHSLTNTNLRYSYNQHMPIPGQTFFPVTVDLTFVATWLFPILFITGPRFRTSPTRIILQIERCHTWGKRKAPVKIKSEGQNVFVDIGYFVGRHIGQSENKSNQERPTCTCNSRKIILHRKL